jgi:hypothetical protein
MRRIVLTPALFLTLLPAGQVAADQKPKENEKKTVLTKEEKEMLKDREMLENLDLLLELDKFECFDLFTEKKAGREKEEKSIQPAQKKSEKEK